MLDARFRPLPKWNRKPGLEYRSSQFKSAYKRTLDLLEYEVLKVNAHNIVIEAGFTSAQIRNDGWPHGGTAPSHPGVVLYFENADGALAFPCGTYSRFEANMHAIALTLEHLRAIDRYGVTLGHQQYLGFASLPPAPDQMSIDAAAEWLASETGTKTASLLNDAESYKMAYRRAAAKLHPDSAGSNDGFYKLSQVKVLLDKHHAGGPI